MDIAYMWSMFNMHVLLFIFGMQKKVVKRVDKNAFDFSLFFFFTIINILTTKHHEVSNLYFNFQTFLLYHVIIFNYEIEDMCTLPLNYSIMASYKTEAPNWGYFSVKYLCSYFNILFCSKWHPIKMVKGQD
jgi:hypothetical protein